MLKGDDWYFTPILWHSAVHLFSAAGLVSQHRLCISVQQELEAVVQESKPLIPEEEEETVNLQPSKGAANKFGWITGVLVHWA